jgi:hypothetical protein
VRACLIYEEIANAKLQARMIFPRTRRIADVNAKSGPIGMNKFKILSEASASTKPNIATAMKLYFCVFVILFVFSLLMIFCDD